MPVSDDIVATVRAYLRADKETFKNLNAALDRSHEASAAYKAMIIAAFIAAVQRKFSKQSSRDEIIEYVSDVRSRSDELPDILDPDASERMIAAIYSGESFDDVDERTAMAVEMYFATAIVNDAGLDGQELDDFLAKARELANDLLS